MADDIEYLEEGTIISINKGLTSAYNQTHFVQQPANLSNLLESVKKYANNMPNKKDRIIAKAGYAFYRLARDTHIFVDGNKRTAVFSLWFFLFVNGYSLNLPYEETLKIALESADSKSQKSLSQVIKWVKKNSKKITLAQASAFGIGMIPHILATSFGNWIKEFPAKNQK